ncbi:plasma protease C1 inhibitor [Eleutherodactylus coqui]|uniref:plasma protease C1 inhibitor n=1 Tax=Eleutherodactylus coqui TaxID=57060 RepID=UPI003461F9BF
MKLFISVLVIVLTAMCMKKISGLGPEVGTEQAKEEFPADPKEHPTEAALNAETPAVTSDTGPRPPAEANVNVNGKEIPTETLNVEERWPTRPPANESDIKRGDPLTADSEERNEASTRSHNGLQSDTKSDRGLLEKDLPSVVASAAPGSNCSMIWPECRNPQDAIEDVSEQLSRFTLNLYKTISSRDEKSNIVIAPISIAFGLSQLMLGSNGKTREDLLKVIFGDPNNQQCVHHAIQNLTESKAFVSANEIFFSKDFSLKEEFTNQSARFYGAEGIQLQKDKKKSLNQINQWVSKKTNRLILSVLKELPDLQLMLINVIHYQGKWMNRFDSKLTKKEAFQTASSSIAKVPMMNNPKYPLQSIHDAHLQAQVARLPLTDNCSLIIFLPLSQEIDALKSVESCLTEEVVKVLLTQLADRSPRATAVSLPRLKLDSDYGLTETLSLIGLHDLFEHPNFCALSDSADLAISDVRHRAVLEISEDGAKAAAATSVTVGRTMSLFSVNKPFLYILVNDNNIPIVIGRVTDPSK